MPDIHWGYGFCIGGVCATDPDEGGVISPGGVGYDINCGVRLMRSNLFYRRRASRICETLDRRTLSQRSRPASAAAASTASARQELRQLDGEAGPNALAGARPGHRARPRPHRGPRLPRRRRARLRQRPGPRARAATSAARSARATTSSKCRSSTRVFDDEAAARDGPRKRTWSA